jgi:hypothetical protein
MFNPAIKHIEDLEHIKTLEAELRIPKAELG